MTRKYFTLAEANRTLPLVKRIVADIVALHPQWRDLVSRYELVAAQAKPDWGESREQLDLRHQVETVARQINDYLLDQCYCMTICGYPNILAQAANVRGLGYYPVLQWTLRSTWLA